MGGTSTRLRWKDESQTALMQNADQEQLRDADHCEQQQAVFPGDDHQPRRHEIRDHQQWHEVIGIAGQQVLDVARQTVRFPELHVDESIEDGRPDEVRPQDMRHAPPDEVPRQAGRLAARRISHERAGDEKERGHSEDAQVTQNDHNGPKRAAGRRVAQSLARFQRQGNRMVQHDQHDRQTV